ncbi:MAG: TolB family protein [Candidatus Bipolaricaulia bacterium]
MAVVTSNVIWSVNLDGSNPRILFEGNNLKMTAKGHLFFKHEYYPIGDEALARDEFYLVDRDFNELRYFKELYGFPPFLSPDETKLIYFAYDDSERGFTRGVYLLDLRTGETVRLFQDVARASFRFHPEAKYLKIWLEWSPDGQKILYVSDREGDQEIYLMDLETRQEPQADE